MRILLLNQFFWPDTSATSQLLTDLARALADGGHEVTVICSQKGGYALRERDGKPSVRVKGVKALPFVRGKLGRILSYLTFYLGAGFAGLTAPKQEVVLTLTTPPLLPLLGTVIKRFRGSRHYIWEMDLYPDVAVDLEYFKAEGILDRLVGKVADHSRSRADGILALGECMADRLERRANKLSTSWSHKIWIAHNWADSKKIVPQFRTTDPERLTVLYSGNIGLAHDFGTLLKTIECLSNEHHFQFVFRGSGARRHEIANFIETTGTTTISLGDSVSRTDLADSLSRCDIGLVTQREVCCGSVVPSKMYGLLAAGKPVLFVGPRDSTVARIVEQFHCGWVIQPGDADALTTLLLRLRSHRSEILAAGILARKALLDHFDMSIGVSRIESILEGRAVRSSSARTPPVTTAITQGSTAIASMANASSN